jgi:hypothetical protein
MTIIEEQAMQDIEDLVQDEEFNEMIEDIESKLEDEVVESAETEEEQSEEVDLIKNIMDDSKLSAQEKIELVKKVVEQVPTPQEPPSIPVPTDPELTTAEEVE